MSIPAKSCSVEGCKSQGKRGPNGARYFAKGLCSKHYKRLLLYGDPMLKKKDLYPSTATPESRAYYGMLRRCSDKKHRNYQYYGARGIKVCDRWSEPNGRGRINFLMDIGKRPTSDHSLDRIDSNGDYEPSNCRWADGVQQNNNTRKNVFITAFGKTQTVAQWVRETGINRSTLDIRLRRGLSGNELFQPAKR